MQNAEPKVPILINKNGNLISKRILTEIPVNYDRRLSKINLSKVSTSRSLTSSISRQNPLFVRNCKQYEPKRSLSMVSPLPLGENDDVPAKASEINDLVNKKNRALRIKYHVNNSRDPVPNLLEIKQSVKKEEISFMRRMDKELNATGNAFLLTRLKQDLHIQYHNYLKETLDRTRKNRKYLIDCQKGHQPEKFVLLRCQLDKDSVGRP